MPYVSRDGYGFGQIAYSAVGDYDAWRPLFAMNGSYIYFHRVNGNGATLANSGGGPQGGVILLGGSYYLLTPNKT